MQALHIRSRISTYCTPLLLLVCICGCLYAETTTERIAKCEAISQSVFEALNAQNPKAIREYLALNFTFVGQKWPWAKMILDGVVEELGGSYTNINRVNEELNKSELTLTYEYLFSKDEEEKVTTASFRFNKRNNIVEIVFHMMKEVKVEGLENEELGMRNWRVRSEADWPTGSSLLASTTRTL